MSNYRQIRKNLKKILPENITVFPGKSLSQNKQEQFLILIDYLQENKAPKKFIVESLGYNLLQYGNDYLITYKVYIPSVIKWCVGKIEPNLTVNIKYWIYSYIPEDIKISSICESGEIIYKLHYREFYISKGKMEYLRRELKKLNIDITIVNDDYLFHL